MTFGARPPEIKPTFTVVSPTSATTGRSSARKSPKGSQQFVDGGLPKFWVGTVRHPAMGAQLYPQGALGGNGQPFVRWLAVDQVP